MLGWWFFEGIVEFVPMKKETDFLCIIKQLSNNTWVLQPQEVEFTMSTRTELFNTRYPLIVDFSSEYWKLGVVDCFKERFVGNRVR